MIAGLLTGWIAGVSLLSFLPALPFWATVPAVAVFAAVTGILLTRRARHPRIWLFGAFCLFTLSVGCSGSLPGTALAAGMTLWCGLYAFHKPVSVPEASGEPASPRAGRIGFGLALLAALLLTGLTCLFTVARYRCFLSPGFDFGIFTQAMDRLCKTGIPLTTFERSVPMSHFAVHLSPILYLLAPFYALFPSPLTLQIACGVLLGLGLLPFYGYCRKKTGKPVCAGLLCLAAALYPALCGGCLYDFHENVFLFPCLTGLLWAQETDRPKAVYLFALLTLTVKEDAALYVAVFALSLLVRRRPCRKRGWILLGMSVLWFGLAMGHLSVAGTGVMTSRYAVYGNSPLSILSTLFTRPQRAVIQIADPAHLPYACRMLLPLLCLPLLTLRPAELLCLLPVTVVNLMPAYKYQYDIYFHYSFGSGAFLLAGMADSFARFAKKRIAATVLAGCLLLTAGGGFFLTVWRDQGSVLSLCYALREDNAEMEKILSGIPEDASVLCSTFLLPHVAQRAEVYELGSGREAEFVILDLRMEGEDEAIYARLIEDPAYTLWDFSQSLIAVFRR